MINKQQEKDYVEKGGVRCPYCLSSNIEAGEVQADSNWITRPVHCKNCGKEWDDMYILSGIIEVE